MTERPSITDKVRFWEEQDRINKELIPRVLKIHQLFTDHVSGHEDAAIQIAAAEARMVEGIKRTRTQAMAVSGVSLVVAVVSLVVGIVL